MLEKGAYVDSRHNNGMTPLMAAAEKGQTPIAELLIAKGADVNATSNDKSTPLSTAAFNGSDNIAVLFSTRATTGLKSSFDGYIRKYLNDPLVGN